MNKFIAVVFVVLAGCAAAPSGGLERIETIVVVYAENRSFDHLYGLFPGANGIADATEEQKTQLDLDGSVLPHLPPVFTPQGKPDERYPEQLPNGPFRIDAPPFNRRWDELLPSPVHAYYQNREQINGGRNNRYVAVSTAGAFVMGYFDGSRMKLWKWAQDYTLADHFFMAAYGGSYLNHLWLICACTPRVAEAPAAARAQIDEVRNLRPRPNSPASVMQGVALLFDGQVAPDGYTVNTMQPPYQPSGVPPASGTNEGGDLNLA
ncbi:MAG TPA: alkaline phosphatase family protein, partial [Burkholderiales bacterium]|nr:alkaline phosphatase family protein [Burkholderiales bacterium]